MTKQCKTGLIRIPSFRHPNCPWTQPLFWLIVKNRPWKWCGGQYFTAKTLYHTPEEGTGDTRYETTTTTTLTQYLAYLSWRQSLCSYTLCRTTSPDLQEPDVQSRGPCQHPCRQLRWWFIFTTCIHPANISWALGAKWGRSSLLTKECFTYRLLVYIDGNVGFIRQREGAEASRKEAGRRHGARVDTREQPEFNGLGEYGYDHYKTERQESNWFLRT